jgi:hypothetical protein
MHASVVGVGFSTVRAWRRAMTSGTTWLGVGLASGGHRVNPVFSLAEIRQEEKEAGPADLGREGEVSQGRGVGAGSAVGQVGKSRSRQSKIEPRS